MRVDNPIQAASRLVLLDRIRGMLLSLLRWQHPHLDMSALEEVCPFVSPAIQERLTLFCQIVRRCAMIIDTNQLLGQTLGNCVLEHLLGQGGMGAVYLAQQVRPRRTVAVKVLLPELSSKSAGVSAEFLAR